MSEKYFDAARFACIVRPQYKYNCSMASLTAVFNFLYNMSLSQEQVMQMLGFKAPYDDIKFGAFASNEAVIKWFYMLLDKFELQGVAKIVWKEYCC